MILSAKFTTSTSNLSAASFKFQRLYRVLKRQLNLRDLDYHILSTAAFSGFPSLLLVLLYSISYPAARSQTCTLKPEKEGNPFPFSTYLKNKTTYLGLCTEMLDLTLRLGLGHNLIERASSYILT